MKYNQKWLRMWKILSFALSVLIRVYWFRFRKKTVSEREKLWEKIGEEFRQLLFQLEGILIKVGQFLSIREDLLPVGFVKQIQDLVDHVPPSPWEKINQELETEWGCPIKAKLLSINHEAVASASIGEVFRGRTLDGKEVAIKVQRPTIQSIIRTDFRSIAIIIWFARHFAPVPKGFINFKMLFQELITVIQRELDFKKEMDTVQHFRERFRSFPKLIIPKVYPDLCTSKVLVMEWIEGVRITDVDFLEKSHINRDELSERLFRLFIPQWLEAGIFHADPHAGNVMVNASGTIILLDFGMVGEISKKDATNFQELLQAIFLKSYVKAAEVLINLGFLLPEVNPKSIANQLKEILSIDLNQLKEMDLFAVKKELLEIVRSLPIQVPTRFVFLARSFATIEGMMHTINPHKELLDIAKPAFMDWLNQSNQSKWKLVLDWINSQPIFQILHSIPSLLEMPQQLLSHSETMQQREFYFTIYENQKKQSFFLGAIALIGAFIGIYLQNPIIWTSSATVIGISFISYGANVRNQRKWLKKNRSL